MISFPASLSPRRLSPLGSRAKVGRERGGHGPETALKPQPLFKWGCSLVHYSAFPSSYRLKRGMWKCILVSFLTRLFFFSPPPWPNSLRVNTRLTCTKKTPGISHFWLCFGLDIPLCTQVSLYSFLFTLSHFLLLSPSTLYTCLLLLAPNTMPKPLPLLFRSRRTGI